MACEEYCPTVEELKANEKELSQRLEIAVSYSGWLRGMVVSRSDRHKGVVADLLAFDKWYMSESVRRNNGES